MSRDPILRSVASAFPETIVDNTVAIDALTRLFPLEDPDFVSALVSKSGIDSRRIATTIPEVLAPATFTERNAQYREAAIELCERASLAALGRAGMRAHEVDVVIDVSCTGIVIPAVDVALSARLGLRSDVRRIPITESGCAAGALALGLAASLSRTGQRVLVVAVELCSLSLVRGDRSRTNLIASVLFGDGAAAAIVTPDGVGPRITAVGSHLIPETSQVMGFDVGDHGLRIVLARELPSVLVEALPSVQAEFLGKNGLSIADIGLHLIHPGGRRVMDAYAAIAGLPRSEPRFSRESLRRYGNLSSASVLTVLELALAEKVRPDTRAFLLAVGPGLSLEMLLLEF
ncbi:MAG: 3-oxoacyl-[acyl-carrier-protein] synthase III C-terminal domain-containing protein [Planctomycetota bacterium]|nr:3-oxoacyl-[acyl-carrier-protein] synthase III C-terminal domain-containing protein [Planctomycetota bacterium]